MDNIELFLNLENFLFDLKNKQKLLEKLKIIKDFIDEYNVEKANVFSEHFFNIKDLNYFNNDIKPLLEDILNIKFNVILLENVFETINHQFNLDLHLNHYLTKHQKEFLFELFINTINTTNNTFVLFDPSVKNKTIFLNDIPNIIIFKNI